MAALNWRDRPVLVTGATGLLGKRLTQRLYELGARIVTIVRDAVDVVLPPGAEVRGDVTDQALIERVLAEYQIATVFHLAAQTQVGTAMACPAGTFDSNIRGTWAVLEACRGIGVEQVVVASSDKVYGKGEMPVSEMAGLNATAPYDVSKACADQIARSYARTYDVPVCVTRCGNLFGPGDLEWRRIVPGTIRSLLHGERPVLRSDGRSRRDYLYVDDAVDAYVVLAEKMASQPMLTGRAFNFSPERPLSVIDMVSAIGRALATDIEPEIRDDAHHEQAELYLDCSAARAALAWESRWPLERALATTVDWYRHHLEAIHASA